MSEHPMYALSEEHQAIREAVRAVCDAKVAPNAADVDESAEFPQASYDALAAADFAAPHIGEEYGGAGADALATCIVIEEVARACASSSLIPARQQARHDADPPGRLGRAEEGLPPPGGGRHRRCSPTASPSPRPAPTPPR